MSLNLAFLDFLYTIAHLLIISFNLCGWMWNRFLRIHLVVISTTAFSWIVLGFWYGWGYCFLTDWHWDVKRQLGETDLPASFITYALTKLNLTEIPQPIIDSLTVILFIVASSLSIYRNFKTKLND